MKVVKEVVEVEKLEVEEVEGLLVVENAISKIQMKI